jgi:DNA-binding transcriptional regulator YhcF (GntR family)
MKNLDKNQEIILDRIDEAIINILKKSKELLSVYKIAKEIKLAWSTVNTHCYKLKSYNILEERTITSKFGGKKTFWGLKAKGPTLRKFIR